MRESLRHAAGFLCLYRAALQKACIPVYDTAVFAVRYQEGKTMFSN
jgi:hypothetical protein